MWQCEECGESIEDQFDACWHCAAGFSASETDPDGAPAAFVPTDDSAASETDPYGVPAAFVTMSEYSHWRFWFSSKGRINRWPYFKAGIVVAGLWVISDHIPLDTAEVAFLWGLVTLVASYVAVMLAIKRSHDRGYSGFFVVLFFVPLLNLWPMFELTFLAGDDGPNAYGDDPLSGF